MGDGTTLNTTDVSHDYLLAGNYNITLLVTNTFGCSHDTSLQITVHPTPTASGLASSTVGCTPLTVQFNNSSIGADSYLWNFGDGNSDTTANASYTYMVGGVFTPQLIAMTNYGCSDTIELSPIKVLQSPDADFYSADTMACKGSTVNFTNTSSNLITPSYFWNLSTSTSTAYNPSIAYIYSGYYDISLVVMNNNGCTDTMIKPAYIHVDDSLPPPADPILSVTVINDNSVDITWQNSSVNDLKYYEVYRLNASTNNYELIYQDANAKNSSSALTTTYRDTALDTKHNTYTYKVLTIDYCGNKLALSSLNPHTTIDITAAQAGVNIFVRWTPYGGCNINTYDLYRTEVATGLVQFVVSVPATQLNYLDTSLSCPFDYSYRITATDLCGNTYTSNSDTSVARPINIMAGQQVSVIRSTVIDNKDVLTEWLPPTIHPERVLEYHIYRSEDNSIFNLIAIVPAALTAYTDMNADINAQEYYYRVLVVNDCNLSGIESNKGSSIFLSGSHENYSTQFNWTPYKDWQQGVDTYQLERINANGVWEIIKVVDGTVTNTTINE
jgi:PKD repeat protein